MFYARIIQTVNRRHAYLIHAELSDLWGHYGIFSVNTKDKILWEVNIQSNREISDKMLMEIEQYTSGFNAALRRHCSL